MQLDGLSALSRDSPKAPARLTLMSEVCSTSAGRRRSVLLIWRVLRAERKLQTRSASSTAHPSAIELPRR